MSWSEPKVYAVKHKNCEVVMHSRSGGMFTALSDYILKDKGIVYGCVMSKEHKVLHTRAETYEQRNEMRGSKYVQSKLGDTYRRVLEDLKTGRKVLFTGTSCQVAGLRSFLCKEYSNLFCVDIVCHGVVSPKVLGAYIKWFEKRNHCEVEGIDFRNKLEFGWRAHVETLKLKNGEQIHSGIFTKIFYGHWALRPACYECKYKSVLHPGDITLADYWGIEEIAPEFDDDKGVSMVFVNNDKGDVIFQEVIKNLEYKKTVLGKDLQVPLLRPYECPEDRKQFWRDFKKKSFTFLARHYAEYQIENRYTRILKRVWRFRKDG